MKTKHFILLIGFVFVLNACKKTNYNNTSTSGPVVFYFNGNINNSPVNIQAGVNNYTMSTSYANTLHNVYIYKGEFMPIGGSQGSPNSLEIFFDDNSLSPQSGSAHIDSVINPGYYSFAIPSGMPTAYSVQFQDYFNQTATGYSWTFGDGQGGSGNAPLHTYQRPGVYTVFMAAASNSCISYDTNDAPVGQVGNAFQSSFSGGAWTGTTTTFSVVATAGVSPSTYTWSFGDGSSQVITATYYASHKYTNQGVYLVSVTQTDATGYTDKQEINVYTPSATGCATGFYAGTQTPIANPYNLNDVVVDWSDNSGTLWTSNNNHQSMKSMFKVTSVADYKNNAAGQPTKIINAIIGCKLYNSAGDSIPLSGNVVVGVAHF
jgi:PKD repeat protein